jgi:hypothetical protein
MNFIQVSTPSNINRGFISLLLALLAGFALLSAPATAAVRPPAGNLGDPGFQVGRADTKAFAHAATSGGGTSPGDTMPPPSGLVGADLRVGRSVSDATIRQQLASVWPLTTDQMVAKVTGAVSASLKVSDLRARILQIANIYLANPTVESKFNDNRSRTVCSLGGITWCGQPWCALFASSVWRLSGVRALQVTPPVSGIVAWGRQHRRWRSAASTPRAGDIVAYGCNGDLDWCQHTGIVVSATRSVLHTIEGNTTSAIKGREGVGARVRDRNSWISGFISLG